MYFSVRQIFKVSFETDLCKVHTERNFKRYDKMNLCHDKFLFALGAFT